MYVCNHLVETDDSLEEMLGLINTDVRMTKRLSMQFGYVTMKALYDTCAAKSDSESDGLLLHGVYGRKTPYNDCIDHGIDECNLWGDYYYLEGLVRLKYDWNPYW